MVCTHMGPIWAYIQHREQPMEHHKINRDFNATIRDALIYLKLKAKTYDLRTL
jgi:hypothetical protein